MKEEFKEYLASIGIGDTLQKRVAQIYQFYQKICPDEIRAIFVTDYLQADGTRVYENLWFFSERYCMEAKQFVTTDDFDIEPMKNKVTYVQIKKQEYDFEKATEKSRFNVIAYLSIPALGALHGELKASKENCDYLKDILLKYIKPNLQG